jgi:predicted ATPase/DNA-binding NarL/FixJ family response regulator
MPATSRVAGAGHTGPAAKQRGGALPAELTSFVGRRQETTEVKRLLGQSRMVTLTGVGGVGKTRLAQRVAAEVRRSFADGVWFIDLSVVRDPARASEDGADPELLAQLIAFELGVLKQSLGAPLELLSDHLCDRRALLVLDNCEHLLPACSRVAQALLQACPQLRILATSREPLDVLGEVRLAVSPLSTPHLDRLQEGELAAYEAVALFLARAQAIQPDFRLDQGNQAAVAELCHRAEGLPLAIELAAARLPVLSPQQILNRLDDRFRLLRRGSRALPERQQTLAACVEWSYELCSKPEQLLWARLAVFVGGCELDEIEGICTDEQLPAADLLDSLAGLVDKSILARDDHGEATRYRMLETLRDYGRNKLVESGEYELLRGRHRQWYQQMVHVAHADWVSDRQVYWYARLRRAHANMRAAVDDCLTQPGAAENALHIAVSLPWVYWWGRRLFAEGRRWLDLALAQAVSPSTTRAHALLLDSRLAFAQGDVQTGMGLLDQGEQLAHELRDHAARAHAAYARGLGALYAGELATAVEFLGRARVLMGQVSEPDMDLKLHVLLHLAVAAGLYGDHTLADSCRQEIIEVTHGGHAFRQLLWAYALVDWSRGRLQEAIEHEREYLRIRLEQGLDDRSGSAVSLEVLAWVAARQHQHRRAATLLGAADALFEDSGTSITAYQHLSGFHHECRQQIHDALGESAFTEAFDQGRGLTYEHALAEALDQRQPATPSTFPARHSPSPLTRREQQIAQLVAQGLRNKEIAAELVISQRTAETHVENILTKLGFTSRGQIATWLAKQPTDHSR